MLFSGAELSVLKSNSLIHTMSISGPLSLIIFKGKPYWENTCINIFMRDIAEVQLVAFITGDLER